MTIYFSPVITPIQSLSYSHQVFTNVIIESVSGLKIAIDSLFPGGTISTDIASVPMSTISITIAIDEVALQSIDLSVSTLSPSGSRLIVSSGIVDAAGDVYEWPVGVFVITSAQASDSGSGSTYVITGSDLSFILNSSILVDNFNISGNITLSAALEQLIAQQSLQAFPTNFILNNTLLAAQTFQTGANIFSTMQSLALQVGCVVYFDQNGILTTAFLPTGTNNPTAWIFDTTSPINIMTSLSYAITASPGYNGVIVTAYSYNSSVPITSVLWDNNPSSPFYYLGPYGQRPYVITSSNVTTQAQADQVASLNYPLILGDTIQATISCTPLPFLQPYSMIGIYSPDDQVNDVLMVSQHTLALDATSMDSITASPIQTYTSQIVQNLGGVQPLLVPIYNGNTTITPSSNSTYTYTFTSSPNTTSTYIYTNNPSSTSTVPIIPLL